MAEIAIRKAQDEKDYSEIENLMAILSQPLKNTLSSNIMLGIHLNGRIKLK